MKLLGHIRSRSRSRLKSTDDTSTYNNYHQPSADTSTGLPKPHPSARFSITLLHELFSYVCPHSRDDSYTSCEESMIDGGCMLCDMRDLSQCALVNRQWSEASQNLLWVFAGGSPSSAHLGLTSPFTGIIVCGSIPSIIATEKQTSLFNVEGDLLLAVLAPRKTLRRNG